MNEKRANESQSKASKAIELAISVFEDVLTDIEGWEDTSLSRAVQSAKSGLLSVLMTEFDMQEHVDADRPLWLWKNGNHFLAFEHLYPCFEPGGDPMVLGEPFATAILKRSFDRAPVPQAAKPGDEPSKVAASEPVAFDGAKLWLWKNGDHYLAFEHLYPCLTPGGDPMVLGEPAATAIFMQSFDRNSLAAPLQPAATTDLAKAVQTLLTTRDNLGWCSETDVAIEALRGAIEPASQQQEQTTVSVEKMTESVNGVSWWVVLRRGKDRQDDGKYGADYRNRAEWHAAGLRWILGQGPKPDIGDAIYQDPEVTSLDGAKEQKS